MEKAIGVIDSGVGGVSVWQEIVKHLPYESTVYLADSANVPYGTKSEEEVYQLSKRLVEFLLGKQVKAIVVACNTITVSCLDRLRNDFSNIPLIGTVPVVKTAAEVSTTKRIGILSTIRTAQSEYQKKLIQQFASDCFIVNLGTDKLVPFVERGEFHGEKLMHVLQQELAPFLEAHVDVLALGCTHFPFLKQAIQQVVGKDVLILDSSAAVARQVERVLSANKRLEETKEPEHVFFTTGDKNDFIKAVQKLDTSIQDDTIQSVIL